MNETPPSEMKVGFFVNFVLRAHSIQSVGRKEHNVILAASSIALESY